MALRFPTLTVQRNRCESGALFHAEQLNGQNNRVLLVTKEKTKHLDNFQAWMKTLEPILGFFHSLDESQRRLPYLGLIS
jgi:hypothetical protein